MRILHIDTPVTWRGGQQQLLYLSLGLRKRGHCQIVVCQPDSALLKRCQEEQIFARPINMRGEWDLAAVWKIVKLIDKEGIQIVHLHSAHAHALGLMAAHLSRLHPKVIVSRRVDFHIHKNPFSQIKYKAGLERVIAVSSKVRDILLEDGLSEERVKVIYEGIDLSRFNGLWRADYLYPELSLLSGQPVVGIIAALAPHKDHPNFFAAAALVKRVIPESHFLVVGEGAMMDRLTGLTKDLNLQKEVVFTGFRTDIPQILSILDVSVISSYLEGLCTTILDVQAAGVPVVATNTGGIPEIIQDNVNGLLVPPQNPSALAQGIIRLLKDKPLAQKLADRARETVKNFDQEIMIEKTEEVYYEVATNGRLENS